jgi:hypothetical protein
MAVILAAPAMEDSCVVEDSNQEKQPCVEKYLSQCFAPRLPLQRSL